MQVNATTKYIAKNVAATSKGLFKIFCNTMASITVATGRAKNSNNVFIFFPSLILFAIYYVQIHKTVTKQNVRIYT